MPLRAIDSKYHSVIRSEIEPQLLHEPDVETRNRKPLKRPIVFGADWEIRLGPDNCFGIFYQVKAESRQVRILAVSDDDELERLLLAHSPKFQALLDKSRRQIEATGGIPHEQFWREVKTETRKPADKNGRGSRRASRSN